jgi:hypothetical protein
MRIFPQVLNKSRQMGCTKRRDRIRVEGDLTIGRKATEQSVADVDRMAWAGIR